MASPSLLTPGNLLTLELTLEPSDPGADPGTASLSEVNFPIIGMAMTNLLFALSGYLGSAGEP